MINDSPETCALGAVKMAHADWETNTNQHWLVFRTTFLVSRNGSRSWAVVLSPVFKTQETYLEAADSGRDSSLDVTQLE